MGDGENMAADKFDAFIDEFADKELPPFWPRDLRKYGNYMIVGSEVRVRFKVYEETARLEEPLRHGRSVEMVVEGQKQLIIAHSQAADLLFVEAWEAGTVHKLDPVDSEVFAGRIEQGLRLAASQGNLIPVIE